MFQIDDDLTIYITRGDIAFFSVSAEGNGELYKFQKGDVVRMKVFEKKNCSNVAFQKDFAVTEECDKVNILLTEEETKIGDVINKAKDYWYEIELNPYTNPQTIIGYDDDGAKILKLFPEGRDLGNETKEEDIPAVDSELSLTSTRPVENQAVTRGLLELSKKVGNTLDTSQIQKTVENAVKEVKNIDGKVDEALNGMQRDVSNIDKKIENVAGNVATLGTNVQSLDNEIKKAANDIVDVNVVVGSAVRSIESLNGAIAETNTSVAVERARIDGLMESGHSITGTKEYDLEIVNSTAFDKGEDGFIKIITNGVVAVLQLKGTFTRIQETYLTFAKVPSELVPLYYAPKIECAGVYLEFDKEDDTDDGWVLKYTVATNVTEPSIGTGRCFYPLKNLCIPEVVDARIGVDAVTYDSLGTAIRTQLNNGGSGGAGESTVKVAEAILPANRWTGDNNLFSQVVNINGVTANSKVDLTPSVEQLAAFYRKDIAFVTENDGGVVTVYAIGEKPVNDYIIQATITEVTYG